MSETFTLNSRYSITQNDYDLTLDDETVATIRRGERERILALLKSFECVGCDLGNGCSFLDSRDYLILVIEENKHERT